MERLFIPIAPYLYISAVLCVCLYLFYSLKREIYRLDQRRREGEAGSDAATRQTRTQLEEMRAELRAAEERTQLLVAPAPAKSGLNLTARTQIVRMFRHGEREESIATKLGLPRNEVKLLLKVHRLAVAGHSGTSAPGLPAPEAAAAPDAAAGPNRVTS